MKQYSSQDKDGTGQVDGEDKVVCSLKNRQPYTTTYERNRVIWGWENLN